jgi:hypothetical protein
MNVSAKLSALFVFLAALSSPLSTSAFGQGSLTPPGAPAPTMQTLDQLGAKLSQTGTKLDQTEPRIPIESLPITITQSGSYYFTKNLRFTAASGTAILVQASDVTIDLMGFTLSSDAAVNSIAINLSGTGCTVRNGSIVGATTISMAGSGASKTWTKTAAGFSFGIFAVGSGHRFIDLTIARCRDVGLSTGNDNVVARCIAYQNGGAGLSAGTISDSIAFENAGDGISTGQNIGGVVSASRAYNNKGDGFSAVIVANCTSTSNGGRGFDVMQANHCIASFNVGDGISAISAALGCTARGNGGHGISIGRLAKDNECDGNGAAGIRFSADGARIEGNNCKDNQWGIQSAAGSNGFIVRNSCRSNSGTPTNPGASGNYDFDRATNTYGPVEIVNGDIAAGANAARASNAWANIQY